MTRETNNPNQTFDFDKIGKRMPYTIPDNYFDRMEQHVWEEIRHEQKKEKTKTGYTSITHERFSIQAHWKKLSAIAAVIALVVTLAPHFAQSAEVDMEEVEQAFCKLSAEDQDFLLVVYQNDVFLYESSK